MCINKYEHCFNPNIELLQQPEQSDASSASTDGIGDQLQNGWLSS
jgi:hypothetical protein